MSTPRFWFTIKTLGCKVNQYESQALREALIKQGGAETDQASRADRILVNSCAVTESAAKESARQLLRMRRENPGAPILFTGCAASVEPPEQLPEGVEIVPQSHKAALTSPLSDAARPSFPPMKIAHFNRRRPVVKVQDGCSAGCAYCVTPKARGRSVSRPLADITAEIRRFLNAGFSEIVLAGINLAAWGREFHPKQDFFDLYDALERRFAPKWWGRARFRLSSIDPAALTDKALETISRSKMLAPSLHLSLQSGSESVLDRMGRRSEALAALPGFLDRLSGLWPHFGLGADLLTGFPGETEAEFEQTRAYVAALPLTRAHVFPFSPRAGTRAYDMPGRLGEEAKKRRAGLLRELAAQKARGFVETLAQTPLCTAVLIDPEAGKGLTEHYVECIFTEEAPNGAGLFRVEPVSAGEQGLFVRPAQAAFDAGIDAVRIREAQNRMRETA